MRILHTTEYYHPLVGGVQEAVKQVSERLAANGQEVYVATSRVPGRSGERSGGVEIVEFDVSGNMAKGLKGEVEEYRDFVRKGKFDIITNFAAQQWATDAILPILESLNMVKVFVPTGFSALFDREYAAYYEGMKKWMRTYDVSVFLSNRYRDIEWARQDGIDNYVVIPNGASEQEFLSDGDKRLREGLGISFSDLLILHVGDHTGLKGHCEAIEIFRRARVKNALFLLVGNGGACEVSCRQRADELNSSYGFRHRNKRILVSRLSRKETVEAYRDADIFLFPSNLECSPIVLFECMASSTPFLTSRVGNADEIVEWSEGGVLLPTWCVEGGASLGDAVRQSTGKGAGWKQWRRNFYLLRKGYSLAQIDGSVEHLEKLCHDPGRRISMGDRGNRVWREKFTWRSIASEYESLYKSLIREKPGIPPGGKGRGAE